MKTSGAAKICASAALTLGCATEHPEPCLLWVRPGFSDTALKGITKAVEAWRAVGADIRLSGNLENSNGDVGFADQPDNPHVVEPVTEAQMAADMASHDIVPEETGADVSEIAGEAHNDRWLFGYVHAPIRLIPEHIEPYLGDQPNAYTAVTIHELGHHFGLKHSKNSKDIMNIKVDFDLNHVTPEAASIYREMYE